MKLNFLYSNIQADVAAIEEELRLAVKSEQAPLVEEAALQLLNAGGKRIRPIFVCLTARLGNFQWNQVEQAAVAVELIHMASIVHDDVVDDADVRRGLPTIKSKWGNHVAMYTGDFLFAKSLEYMTKISNLEAHQVLSKVTVELAVGEIEQLRAKYDFEQNVRTYLRRIKRKTALLIAASCELGGIVAQLDPKLHRKLFLFGYYVGMSFQITDDVLDFTGSEKTLGKPAGEDLRQGNVTLPVFFAMEDKAFRAKLRQISETTTKEDMAPFIEAIKASGAIAKSEAIAETYLQKAIGILDEFPPSKELKPLKQIVQFLDKRKY
ncbi:heptaprenyl diphosphate synthase component II [Listeria booriae]|uniref:Heptaprenyl diphosphate synthase component 2 n=1 Tax=Listeria booriae TaxID=1552123 RepID=A0A099W936_9LIST|nr:heptaprenyl diphosphate synthase component II [Listeria booriae]KGL40635.1 heptaprenyl diphosphate synthase [Listeria booriae]MBC1372989.1 heptaprenyl diphosphate synthase component II [Listeria booriae]MBC1811017.1 heptaprenyl diphosphate synthase component II [Listeria booriae]MBC2056961.1 heptaprenyl diphosphate synthase component II [Listeria booriae]STY42056.1 Heptaprenyl diphosphate synthase component 2 [Listeria booriae]